jgi:hypothetical protein
MDEFDLLAELIREYPTELVTRSGCEGLAKYLIESGVTFKAAVPGHKDLYNVAEMAYENGFAKGFTQGYEEGKHKPEKRGRWIIHVSGHGANGITYAECSECRVCGSPQWKVCPVCEARMENHSAINIEEVDFDYAAED